MQAFPGECSSYKDTKTALPTLRAVGASLNELRLDEELRDERVFTDTNPVETGVSIYIRLKSQVFLYCTVKCHSQKIATAVQ